MPPEAVTFGADCCLNSSCLQIMLNLCGLVSLELTGLYGPGVVVVRRLLLRWESNCHDDGYSLALGDARSIYVICKKTFNLFLARMAVFRHCSQGCSIVRVEHYGTASGLESGPDWIDKGQFVLPWL